jgi:ParB family chromosome partitioning protein
MSRIIPSKTNPRKSFDEASMKELIESIKEKGIVYPITCRPLDPKGEKYEIIDGERRYRAAKVTGETDVPVDVRVMNDDEAVDAQLISFVQRKDVHPLDEAEGLWRLLGKTGETTDVAARIGKPVSYVEQRLKLIALIDPAKKAFLADALTIGHAILLCRLQPVDQKRAFEFAMKNWQRFHGDYEYGNSMNPDIKAEDNPRDYMGQDARTACSVKDLKEFIDARINLDLRKAAFDVKDALMLPKAGACIVCPKRTGFNMELFDDISKGDFCTDSECYHAKQQAFLVRLKNGLKIDKKKYVEITRDQRKPEGHPGSMTERSFKYVKGKPCKFTRTGIFIDADSKGKTALICSAKKECKQHFSEEMKYKKETGIGGPEPRISYEEQKRLDKIKNEKGEKRFKALATEIWNKIPDKLDLPQKRLIEILAELIHEKISYDLKQFKPKGFTPSTIQTINLGFLCEKYTLDVRYDGSIHPDIYKACKELGIKHEPILQKISDEEKAEEKKNAEPVKEPEAKNSASVKNAILESAMNILAAGERKMAEKKNGPKKAKKSKKG